MSSRSIILLLVGPGTGQGHYDRVLGNGERSLLTSHVLPSERLRDESPCTWNNVACMELSRCINTGDMPQGLVYREKKQKLIGDLHRAYTTEPATWQFEYNLLLARAVTDFSTGMFATVDSLFRFEAKLRTVKKSNATDAKQSNATDAKQSNATDAKQPSHTDIADFVHANVMNFVTICNLCIVNVATGLTQVDHENSRKSYRWEKDCVRRSGQQMSELYLQKKNPYAAVLACFSALKSYWRTAHTYRCPPFVDEKRSGVHDKLFHAFQPDTLAIPCLRAAAYTWLGHVWYLKRDEKRGHHLYQQALQSVARDCGDVESGRVDLLYLLANHAAEVAIRVSDTARVSDIAEVSSGPKSDIDTHATRDAAFAYLREASRLGGTEAMRFLYEAGYRSPFCRQGSPQPPDSSMSALHKSLSYLLIQAIPAEGNECPGLFTLEVFAQDEKADEFRLRCAAEVERKTPKSRVLIPETRQIECDWLKVLRSCPPIRRGSETDGAVYTVDLVQKLNLHCDVRGEWRTLPTPAHYELVVDVMGRPNLFEIHLSGSILLNAMASRCIVDHTIVLRRPPVLQELTLSSCELDHDDLRDLERVLLCTKDTCCTVRLLDVYHNCREASQRWCQCGSKVALLSTIGFAMHTGILHLEISYWTNKEYCEVPPHPDQSSDYWIAWRENSGFRGVESLTLVHTGMAWDCHDWFSANQFPHLTTLKLMDGGPFISDPSTPPILWTDEFMSVLQQRGPALEWNVLLDYNVKSNQVRFLDVLGYGLKELHVSVPFMKMAEFSEAMLRHPRPWQVETFDLTIQMSKVECRVFNVLYAQTGCDVDRLQKLLHAHKLSSFREKLILASSQPDLGEFRITRGERTKEKAVAQQRGAEALLCINIGNQVAAVIKKLTHMTHLSVKWTLAHEIDEIEQGYGPCLMYIRETYKMMEAALQNPHVGRIFFGVDTHQEIWHLLRQAIDLESESSESILADNVHFAHSLTSIKSFVIDESYDATTTFIAERLRRNKHRCQAWTQVAPLLAYARANASSARPLMWSCLPLCRTISDFSEHTFPPSYKYVLGGLQVVPDEAQVADLPLGFFVNTKFAKTYTHPPTTLSCATTRPNPGSSICTFGSHGIVSSRKRKSMR